MSHPIRSSNHYDTYTTTKKNQISQISIRNGTSCVGSKERTVLNRFLRLIMRQPIVLRKIYDVSHAIISLTEHP